MVFKNKLFFSSKKSDSSSPDGSSPRSLGSNSPIRSDKKKPKSTSKDDAAQILSSSTSFSAVTCKQTQVKDGVKKKEPKGKEPIPTQIATSTGKPGVSGSGSGSKLKKEVPSSVSPILASSLGLNRIKTRSGPLPQESFFSFKGDKGSAASNLSRAGGYNDGNSSSGKSGSGGKKKDLMSRLESVVVGDNASNSDSMSVGSGGQSREQSPNVQAKSRLQIGESSSEAGIDFFIL